MWRVFREQAMTLFAGGRALLLQVAHPLVAAGVEQHSDYRHDPWGRLERTLDILLAIIFGDARAATAAAARLERRHAAVFGTDGAGRTYSALDPELLMWVHATLVETALVVYHEYIEPLTDDERERLYAESIVLAEAFGIPAALPPPDLSSFSAYFERMLDDALEATGTLHAVAQTVFAPPRPRTLAAYLPAPVWRVALVPAGEAIRLATIGLSPPQLRALLGVGFGPHERIALAVQKQVTRRVVSTLPAALRFSPYARAAEERCLPR